MAKGLKEKGQSELHSLLNGIVVNINQKGIQFSSKLTFDKVKFIKHS